VHAYFPEQFSPGGGQAPPVEKVPKTIRARRDFAAIEACRMRAVD
jgi:hypothetical protein